MPFWEDKTLEELDPEEWEALCDGCGRCCVLKVQDEETGEIFQTTVACRLLDLESGRCKAYAERARLVPECIPLRPDNIRELTWLPPSCAYRRLAEGQTLPEWHPLLTNDPDSVRRAGMSIQDRLVSEIDVAALEDHIIFAVD